MDKRFTAFDPHQVLLLPSPDDWPPEDHLARFVAHLVDDMLDLSPVLADYTEKRGSPPYDPPARLRLHRPRPLLPGNRAPSGRRRRIRSIARFRRRHLDAFAGLFTQSLHLATKLGTVKMGRVAPDGTKMEANTSKRKAMSYGHRVDKEERIEAKVAALEAKAHGPAGRRGDRRRSRGRDLQRGRPGGGPAGRVGPAGETPGEAQAARA